MTIQDAPKKGSIQSLVRAVGILETVASHRNGIGLADLCKAIGLHNSTAHHLAQTLVSEGLLRQDAASKTYRVGSRLFGLASSSLDEIEIHDAARPILAELAQSTCENTHVAVWSGNHVVIIGRCEGNSSVRVAERVGVLRPAYATAIGKCMLAGLGPSELESYFQNNPLDPVTEKTITNEDSLRDALNETRQLGCAEDNGEMDLEIRCLAVPVRDFSGRIIASVGISAPIWRMDDANVEKLRGEVVAAGQQLSRALGHRK